jgi:protein transport protein SEC13
VGVASGEIGIIERNASDQWDLVKFEGHHGGISSVSWAPATLPRILSVLIISNCRVIKFMKSFLQKDLFLGEQIKRSKFGHSKKVNRCFKFLDLNEYVSEELPKGHTDWVRDVAWAPNAGNDYELLASCSEDKTVLIWKKGPDYT